MALLMQEVPLASPEQAFKLANHAGEAVPAAGYPVSLRRYQCTARSSWVTKLKPMRRGRQREAARF